MPLYTVIGLHDVHGRVSWRHIEAKTALGAMVQHARELDGDNGFQIIGALAGEHELETPHSGDYLTAYARDLVNLKGD